MEIRNQDSNIEYNLWSKNLSTNINPGLAAGRQKGRQNLNELQKFSSLLCRHILYMLNKNSLGPLKKGAAKQSRINSVVWHLRWLVRTKADISLRPKLQVNG